MRWTVSMEHLRYMDMDTNAAETVTFNYWLTKFGATIHQAPGDVIQQVIELVIDSDEYASISGVYETDKWTWTIEELS